MAGGVPRPRVSSVGWQTPPATQCCLCSGVSALCLRVPARALGAARPGGQRALPSQGRGGARAAGCSLSALCRSLLSGGECFLLFLTLPQIWLFVLTCPGRSNADRCTFCVCGNDHVTFSLVCKFGNTLISPASGRTRTPLVPQGCFSFVLPRMVCTHVGLECSVLAGVRCSHGAGFRQHAGTSRVGLVAFLTWPMFTRSPSASSSKVWVLSHLL